MKQLLLISALVALSFGALTNKQQLCNKIFKLGITNKVTNNATCANILTCWEPSILARKPVANLTSDLLNCVISKSSSYYVTVMGIYNTMNNCIGRNTLDMLKQMGSAISPQLTPLYNTMISKLKDWQDTKKQSNATVLDNWYKWIVGQATTTLIDGCCTKIVNKAGLSQNDWTCSKDPTKGGQAFDTTQYACNKKMPPAASGKK